MTRRNKPRSAVDAFTMFTAGLRNAAVRPTIYGYEPMEKQEVFHRSDAKGKQYLGGNRSGKTVGGATESIWWLMGIHPFRDTPNPPIRGRCVSVDFLDGVEKIVRPEIARWAPTSALLGGNWDDAYDKELRTLYFANGSFLEFMSYDQQLSKFAGTSRHFIWFDEEPPKSIFNECRARLVDTGGSWWMTMTPVDGMTWTYDEVYVRASTDPNYLVVQTEMTDNKYLGQGEIEMFVSTLDPDEREARLKGKYIPMGGLIYKMFSAEKHIIPTVVGSAFWPGVKKDWFHFICMDHGFNNPTAWLFCAADKDGRVIVYDELYDHKIVVEKWAQILKRRVMDLQIEAEYIVGDPSIRNTDPIIGHSIQSEYAQHGVPIALGNNDVDAGINLVVQMLLNGRLFITRNCVNLIREFHKYRWQVWASTKAKDDRNVKETPHKKDDHALDALRYGVASRPLLEDKVAPEQGWRPPAATKPDLVDPYWVYAKQGEKEFSDANFSLGNEF